MAHLFRYVEERQHLQFSAILPGDLWNLCQICTFAIRKSFLDSGEMEARARRICFSSDLNHKSSMNLTFSFKLAVCIFIAFKFFNLLAEWNPCDFINCGKRIAENAMNEMKCNWNATNFQCLLCMTCVLYFWNVSFRGGGGGGVRKM